MRKMRASARFTKQMVKTVPVAFLVSLLSNGVILSVIMKPRRFATTLISPQLSVSPTRSFAVYSTASSNATKIIGNRKKPMALEPTHKRVRSARVLT